MFQVLEIIVNHTDKSPVLRELILWWRRGTKNRTGKCNAQHWTRNAKEKKTKQEQGYEMLEEG